MDNNTTKKLKIGITIGDINGIGLEVVLKTLSDKRIMNLCTPIIYGATKIVSYHKNVAKINQLTINNAKSLEQIKENVLNILNCWTDNVKITLGQCTEEGGKFAYLSLEKATEDLKSGYLDAIVTAPINKEAMNKAGFPYTGHTEYLTDKLESPESLMLMVHENLRVGLVTNHLPISQVAAAITTKSILKKIESLHQSLCMDFNVNKPVIAVLGLNPHAGDGGLIGQEEKEIILPAIEAAKAKGILAIGPYPADGLFGSKNYSNFDGILAMYHDQGLTPFKVMAFGGGVNFTAGLSAIRTSPDHGTGYDIAGKGIADASSFRQALYLAIDTAKQRKDYLSLVANPLQKASAKELADLENHSKRSYRKKKTAYQDNKEVTPKAEPKAAKEAANKEQTPKVEPKAAKEAPKKEVTPKAEPKAAKEAPKKEVTPKVEPKAAKEAPKKEVTPKVEPKAAKEAAKKEVTPKAEPKAAKEAPKKEVTPKAEPKAAKEAAKKEVTPKVEPKAAKEAPKKEVTPKAEPKAAKEAPKKEVTPKVEPKEIKEITPNTVIPKEVEPKAEPIVFGKSKPVLAEEEKKNLTIEERLALAEKKKAAAKMQEKQ